MLSLHLPPTLARIGHYFADSDHGAWGVLVFAIVTGALICFAFLSR